MADEKQLGNRTAAVVGDQVDARDPQRVKERYQHGDLRVWANILTVANLCVAHRQEVRGNATPVRGKPFERTSPLETIERESMEKQRYVARTTLYVSDVAERRRRESARGVKGGGVQGAPRFNGRASPGASEGTRKGNGCNCAASQSQKVSAIHINALEGWAKPSRICRCVYTQRQTQSYLIGCLPRRRRRICAR
jgi:hypothetical protein